jgi:hypothetical protein
VLRCPKVWAAQHFAFREAARTGENPPVFTEINVTAQRTSLHGYVQKSGLTKASFDEARLILKAFRGSPPHAV